MCYKYIKILLILFFFQFSSFSCVSTILPSMFAIQGSLKPLNYIPLKQKQSNENGSNILKKINRLQHIFTLLHRVLTENGH